MIMSNNLNMEQKITNGWWEFLEDKRMLYQLIGQNFGSNPEEKLLEIIEYKKSEARNIAKYLALDTTHTVLEIGSGIGAMSAEIAPRVKQLYCCDISQSFLKVAEKTCAGIQNISFHHITNAQLHFLEDRCLDAVFSFNVFIHFNLFDIYWYLHELSRVVKSGGKVWFDVALTDTLTTDLPPLFLSMANLYHEDNSGISALVQWNSGPALTRLINHFEFEVIEGGYEKNPFLLVRK